MSHLETWTRADIAHTADRIAFVAQLTPRELRILRLIADGKTHGEMAAELCVSPGTVKMHAQRVIRKLGARNGASAVDLAYQFGVLKVGAYPCESKGDAGYPPTSSPPAARPLLPSGGEVREEFCVEIERPNGELDNSMWVGSRALAEDLLRRPYKFDQHRLQRRVVHTWPNGAKYIRPPEVIDTFPPVLSDNSEASGG